MPPRPRNLASRPDIGLQIFDPKQIERPSPQPPAQSGLGSLRELLKSIEAVTGLEASIYPPPQRGAASRLESLPLAYRQHTSAFCRAARRTHDHRGCRGHDSLITNQRAAELGRPFVQTCHRGVAEVIVPIFHGDEHLGTVFFGQAVTPSIEQRGFEALWNDARSQVTSKRELARGFDDLPRLNEQRLEHIGCLADCAIRGLAHRLSDEAFAVEVRLHHAPAIRQAIDLLRLERCWDTPAAEIARRVGLSPAHFSRLFHRVVGRTFSAYLDELRFKQARLLLNHTELKIVEIAGRCGYCRQSYFTRRFRERYGVTPTQYRLQGAATSSKIP